MATLYKRATPSQARMLRIIAGAVKNEADAHGKEFCPRQARSIAKRAVGTLTASWPEVLAAKSPSKKAVRASANPVFPTGSGKQPRVALTSCKGYESKSSKAQEGGVSQLGKGLLLLRLCKLEKWMFSQMRSIKDSGNTERFQAFVDVLRKISTLKEDN